MAPLAKAAFTGAVVRHFKTSVCFLVCSRASRISPPGERLAVDIQNDVVANLSQLRTSCVPPLVRMARPPTVKVRFGHAPLTELARPSARTSSLDLRRARRTAIVCPAIRTARFVDSTPRSSRRSDERSGPVPELCPVARIHPHGRPGTGARCPQRLNSSPAVRVESHVELSSARNLKRVRVRLSGNTGWSAGIRSRGHDQPFADSVPNTQPIRSPSVPHLAGRQVFGHAAACAFGARR